MLETIHKVGEVLRQFNHEHPEWGASDLAARLNLPRSTVHGLLKSLADLGLLERSKQGRYRIGWLPMHFAQSRLWGSTLVYSAHQLMAELRLFHNATAYVAVLNQGQIIFVLWSVGAQADSLDLSRTVYKGAGFHSAAGKLLWSGRSWHEVLDQIAQDKLDPDQPGFATDLDVYKAELERVRTEKIALSLGEVVPDWGDMAAPVFDENDAIIAAIGFIFPSQHFANRMADYQHSLQTVSAKLSQRLRSATSV